MKKLIFIFFSIIVLPGSSQNLRFFEFDSHSEYPDSLNFIAASSDTGVISKAEGQLNLPEDQRFLHINGRIDHGTGNNNPLYSWHFVANEWDLVEISVEVCDGRPLEDVENDTAYWIRTIGYFCPWNSYVKREILPSSVENDYSGAIRIHPNPVSEKLTVAYDPVNAVSNLQLVNAEGQVLFIQHKPESNTCIDLSGMPKGTYFVIFQMNSEFMVRKIIKK